jgi:two-component system, OmpR family, KDP operon response regulator KdpE
MFQTTKRVLIVDDDPGMRRMLELTLKSYGLTPILAQNTQQALSRVAAADVILLDLALGQEDGWETLRMLREVAKTPVVIMSGSDVDDALRLDARTRGAQGIVQKPFDMDGLLSFIGELAGK